MNIDYGQSNTYKYKLSEDDMKLITDKTRRSANQTQFLFQLVDGDIEKLKLLEEKIKNNHYSACPGDKETVNDILKEENKSNWFKF